MGADSLEELAAEVSATLPMVYKKRRGQMGDRFLSSAGAGGNCARPMRLPDPSPVLDKNRAPTGPEILSSTGAGVWRKVPMAFSDSSSVRDKFQSAIKVAVATIPSSGSGV